MAGVASFGYILQASAIGSGIQTREQACACAQGHRKKHRKDVEQALRDLKARTREELCDAVAKALNMVTADDAQGWFASCGYIKS